jgi:hypothetical protein
MKRARDRRTEGEPHDTPNRAGTRKQASPKQQVTSNASTMASPARHALPAAERHCGRRPAGRPEASHERQPPAETACRWRTPGRAGRQVALETVPDSSTVARPPMSKFPVWLAPGHTASIHECCGPNPDNRVQSGDLRVDRFQDFMILRGFSRPIIGHCAVTSGGFVDKVSRLFQPFLTHVRPVDAERTRYTDDVPHGRFFKNERPRHCCRQLNRLPSRDALMSVWTDGGGALCDYRGALLIVAMEPSHFDRQLLSLTRVHEPSC